MYILKKEKKRKSTHVVGNYRGNSGVSIITAPVEKYENIIYKDVPQLSKTMLLLVIYISWKVS